jgi:4-hydroxyphenylpyruvate dioxygenase
MGPFPHDAPAAVISEANPMGTDGLEFVEYAHPEPEKLGKLFETMGFTLVAKHRSKNVQLWRQGDVNFVVNAEPDSFAQRFAAEHGPCACAMAFRVVDAKKAYERALSLGAEPGETSVGPMELAIPAIKGIGGSLLYFVDRYGAKGSIWDVDFVWTGERDPKPETCGLYYLDHLTHNVNRGRMDHWAGWYQKLFNFRDIRFFNIEGKLTGLISRAMTSPCGKIRIPINESLDDKSQIEEYLREYKGGHPACRDGVPRYLRKRREARRQRPSVHAAAARDLLREDRCAGAGPWRGDCQVEGERRADRRRGRCRWRDDQGAAADLFRHRARPDLL